ncbi:alpha-(1-2)-phosphatidylinositol mannosyltransferase, partial [Mycobacterium sp. ITM-2017-0098]
MRIWRSPDGAGWGPTLAWRLFQLATLAALVAAAWRLLGHVPYRIDIDVYRMGGRAWLDNRSLYADGVMFQTRGGLELPFTYPPLAAVAFSPFALLSLEAASIAITATTLILLVVSTVILLTRLDVWPTTGVTGEPAWVRRCWLAAAIVAPAVTFLEPLRSNFDFGQINVVLMTLVIADCVPRRTPWPRGVLLGIAIALKLTPAVFLLYFLLRRD